MIIHSAVKFLTINPDKPGEVLLPAEMVLVSFGDRFPLPIGSAFGAESSRVSLPCAHSTTIRFGFFGSLNTDARNSSMSHTIHLAPS